MTDQLTKRQRSFFFGLILFAGLFFSLVVPPFQSPDEFHHSFKIHHLVAGHFYGEIDTPSVSLGGVLPKSLIGTSEFYQSLVFHPEVKAPLDTLRKLFKIPLNSKDKAFIAFPNTARYAFTSYLATIPVFYLADKFELNPLYTLYLGRLANFFFWFCCIFIGFQLMPQFKDLYLLLCVIPGTLTIQASLSADTVSNGFLFLLIALFFDFKFSNRPISTGKLMAFFILTLIVSWNKIVYFPLLFTLLLVPKEHFKKASFKWIFISSLFLSVLSTILWWNSKVDKLIYPFEDIHKNTYHNLHEREDTLGLYVPVNPRLQIERIKKVPFSFMATFSYAVIELFSYNNKSYVSNIGWESRPIYPVLNVFFVVFYFWFILGLPKIFSRRERVFLAALAYCMAALFLLSQHLHWDEVGEKMIKTYLGKYYVAIYPLLFFAISGLFNFSEKFKLLQFKGIFYLSLAVLMAHLALYWITIERYYLY
jgi:uncharacterized membrane protein